jgi:hypothetical protein
MVQILERRPSFAEELGRGLGSGFGSGIQRGLDVAQQLGAVRAKKKERSLERLPGQAQKWLKQFGPSFLANEKAYNEFRTRAADLVEQGYDPEDAFSMAKESFTKGQLSSLGASTQKKLMEILSPEGRHKFGAIGEYLEPAAKAVKEKPSLLASEFPIAALKSGEAAQGMVDPTQLGLNSYNLAASLLGRKPVEKHRESSIISDRLRRDLPEHLKEGAERVSDIESLLLDLALPLGAEGKLEKGAERGALQAGEKLGLQEAEGLAGRAGKALEGATEMRMSRLAPESKLFKTGEQTKVLQEQLKLHPKYAAEIAADAEKRAARLNRVIGPRALATKEARMAMASKELPEASKAYQIASARVRALEDEMARIPEEARGRLQPLFEAAKNELRDSEFYLKQMLNNSKTGEARVGLEEMRRAAHQKMLDMESAALEGKPIQLAKADYNPEHIKLAKDLAKKKPLPTSRQMDDFYTQVHDAYAKEYAKRIAQLDAEIARPSKSLAEGMSKRSKVIERDNLQKLMQSAEAENAIHRHNLALREIGQRKLARDRLASASRTEAPHVTEAAKPGLESQARIAESLKSAEGRAQLAEDMIQKAAQENPKLAPQLERERTELQKVFDKVNKKTQEAKEVLSTTASSEKEAVNIAKVIKKDWVDAIESMKRGDLSFFKTRVGRDFLTAVATNMISEAAEEFGFKKPHSSIITAFLGNPYGAGSRYLFSWAIRGAIDHFKKENYKSALKGMDDTKAIALRNKYKKSIIKEAEEELLSSF